MSPGSESEKLVPNQKRDLRPGVEVDGEVTFNQTTFLPPTISPNTTVLAPTLSLTVSSTVSSIVYFGMDTRNGALAGTIIGALSLGGTVVTIAINRRYRSALAEDDKFLESLPDARERTAELVRTVKALNPQPVVPNHQPAEGEQQNPQPAEGGQPGHQPIDEDDLLWEIKRCVSSPVPNYLSYAYLW